MRRWILAVTLALSWQAVWPQDRASAAESAAGLNAGIKTVQALADLYLEAYEADLRWFSTGQLLLRDLGDMSITASAGPLGGLVREHMGLGLRGYYDADDRLRWIVDGSKGSWDQGRGLATYDSDENISFLATYYFSMTVASDGTKFLVSDNYIFTTEKSDQDSQMCIVLDNQNRVRRIDFGYNGAKAGLQLDGLMYDDLDSSCFLRRIYVSESGIATATVSFFGPTSPIAYKVEEYSGTGFLWRSTTCGRRYPVHREGTGLAVTPEVRVEVYDATGALAGRSNYYRKEDVEAVRNAGYSFGQLEVELEPKDTALRTAVCDASVAEKLAGVFDLPLFMVAAGEPALVLRDGACVGQASCLVMLSGYLRPGVVTDPDILVVAPGRGPVRVSPLLPDGSMAMLHTVDLGEKDESQVVVVRIESSPTESALVSWGGLVLGNTPMNLELDRRFLPMLTLSEGSIAADYSLGEIRGGPASQQVVLRFDAEPRIVSVTTSPTASAPVYLEGTMIGMSPLALETRGPSPIHLKIASLGNEASFELDVPEPGPYTFDLPFDAEPRIIDLRSIPSRATVKYLGKVVGKTRLRSLTVYGPRPVLDLDLKFYDSVQETLQLADGQPQLVTVRMPNLDWSRYRGLYAATGAFSLSDYPDFFASVEYTSFRKLFSSRMYFGFSAGLGVNRAGSGESKTMNIGMLKGSASLGWQATENLVLFGGVSLDPTNRDGIFLHSGLLWMLSNRFGFILRQPSILAILLSQGDMTPTIGGVGFGAFWRF